MKGLNHASSQNMCPISTEHRRRCGYIVSGKVRSLNSTGVLEGKVRWKREYSDEIKDFDEINVMDQILDVNRRLRVPRGLSIRDGDIASSHMQSAISCPGNACLWPKSVDGFVYIPYIFSPLYDDMDRITIETGMQDISSGTCIKFVPRTHEANFLDIQPRYGCWSFLGQIGGSQTLSLQSPGCMWSGVAAHEFMHALGFVHEQSRSDRDHYVTIVWKNIIPEHIHNFKKQVTNNLNSPYDYSSVMHYGRYAFSDGGGPTIIPKPDPYIPIGQRDGPSALDLHKINVLYDCDIFVTFLSCRTINEALWSTLIICSTALQNFSLTRPLYVYLHLPMWNDRNFIQSYFLHCTRGFESDKCTIIQWCFAVPLITTVLFFCTSVKQSALKPTGVSLIHRIAVILHFAV
ncbi:hypothetical protein Q5P01_013445 [Channa striata]|uniref:Metalloendopeptidase n=1 Tax=Channa striata TaxID=64152 RepID=A0AA88MMR7_CHASR|nr:hypothetical protein Q5P01_013445 [Channa striata]